MTAERSASMGTRAPSRGESSRARTGCIRVHKQCGTAHVRRSQCPVRMAPRYHVIGCGIHVIAVCMHCTVAGPSDSRLRAVARRHWHHVLLRKAISQPVHSKLLLPRRSFFWIKNATDSQLDGIDSSLWIITFKASSAPLLILEIENHLDENDVISGTAVRKKDFYRCRQVRKIPAQYL